MVTKKGTYMAISDVAVQVSPEVNQFIAGKRKMLIDGQWVDAASGKTFPVYNPATGEVMANVAEGDKEDIDRAVRAARRAFESGPLAHNVTFPTRTDYLSPRGFN